MTLLMYHSLTLMRKRVIIWRHQTTTMTMKMMPSRGVWVWGMKVCVCDVVFVTLCRYSVENSYLEEKEDTCNALGEIAENVG